MLDAEPAPVRPGVAVAAPQREVILVEAPPASPLRTGAVIAGGFALAGLTTFVVAGAMSRATHADLEGACGGGPCPPGHQNEIDRGRTQQTIANVGLGVAIAGAGAAITLFVLGTPKANVSAGLGDVRLSGSF